MKIGQVRILVTLFLLSLLFLNKSWLVAYGWGISLLMYGAFILDIRGARNFDFRPNVHGYRIFLLCCLSFVSLAWAPDPGGSGIHVIMMLVGVANSFILYYFLVRYNLFQVLVYVALAYSFINYSLAFGLPVFRFLENKNEEVMRFMGTELNPNYLAIMLIFSIFLSLMSFRRPQSSAMKVVHITNMLLAVYTIFLTASRKGIAFSLLLIFFYVLLHARSILFAARKWLIGIALAVAVLSFTNMGTISEKLVPALERIERFTSTMDGKDAEGSTEERVGFIKEGWEQFTARPFTGYGIDSFRYYHQLYAHNNYIELLFDVGILGVVIFYSIHFSIFRKLGRYRTGAFIGAFLLVLMIMDIGLVSYYDKRVMLMLLSVVILSNEAVREQQYKRQLAAQQRQQLFTQAHEFPSPV